MEHLCLPEIPQVVFRVSCAPAVTQSTRGALALSLTQWPLTPASGTLLLWWVAGRALAFRLLTVQICLLNNHCADPLLRTPTYK